jgi:hypothetical protein
MKFVKVFISLLVVLAVCTASTMENKKKGMYIVGVSASFTDSLIYFTDIQFVKNLTLGNDKLLYLRSHYSDQLDEHLESEKGLKNRTSFVYYSPKKEKLEKIIKKMKNKYRKEGKSVLRDLGSDFKFIRVIEGE